MSTLLPNFLRAFFKTGCTKNCNTCPLLFSCMNKKSLLKPIPSWLWGAGFAALSFPLAIAYNAGSFPVIKYFAGDQFVRIIDEQEQLRRYQDILKKVGVTHPERVTFVETVNLGPLAIGSNSSSGAYIFLPRIFNKINEPDSDFTIFTMNDDDERDVIFSGKSSELTDEIRDKILHATGTLLPTQTEIDYIIGHEGAHIASHHSLITAACVGSSFLSSHLLIKSYNYAVTNYKNPLLAKFPSMKLGISKGWLPYILLTTSLSTVSTIFSSWRIERSADIQSAMKLNCVDAALSLIDKKMEQNKVIHSSFLTTSSGNDYSSLEHPPLTQQRRYISELKH